MKVEFTKNIGSADASAFGLDFTKCLQGMSQDVSDAVGESLVKRRLAKEIAVTKPQREMKGVSPAVDEIRPAKPESGKAKSEPGSVERVEEELQEFKDRSSRKPASATPATPETIGKNPHDPAK